MKDSKEKRKKLMISSKSKKKRIGKTEIKSALDSSYTISTKKG